MTLRVALQIGTVRRWTPALASADLLSHVRKLSGSSTPEQPAAKAPINFDDTAQSFKSQSTFTLVRSLVVFRACSIPWFVEHAGQLLKLSRAVLGEKLTMKLVKHTFYAQFCAGETDEELQRKVLDLRSRGIGSILDYAAEDDVSSDSKPDKKQSDPKPDNKQAKPPAGSSGDNSTSTSTPPPTTGSPVDGHLEGRMSPISGMPLLPSGTAVARQYPYSTESQCDAHVKIFLSCIDSASKASGSGGFAAVKLTALGNPMLLERVSTAIREVRAVFKRWDSDRDGRISRDEFNTAYKVLLPDATEEEQKRVFAWMDSQGDGQVDWVSWCQRLSLSRMPEFAARIHSGGDTGAWQESLRAAVLTPEEVKLVQAMRARLARLAAAAAKAGVKLLIDAEHTYFQPAIDHLTLELMRNYNTGKNGAIIYNTWQAYRYDIEKRVVDKLERARREKYILGVKLVRGAYMEIERARAAALGYPSPIWDTLQETHDCYNRCTKMMLEKVKEGRAEVLLGTHNQESIELAVAHMATLGLDPGKSHVYFGQLLGMSDHLTQALGGAGYNAYKYTPYGRVDQVVPYLLRRASENASVMKGAKRDMWLLQAEVIRRARVALGMQAAGTSIKKA